MDNIIKAILPALIVISALAFIVSQGAICIAMPQQWFDGLVSGTILVLCIWYKRRE